MYVLCFRFVCVVIQSMMAVLGGDRSTVLIDLNITNPGPEI